MERSDGPETIEEQTKPKRLAHELLELEEKVARLEGENAILVQANTNLTGGFLTVLKDLRKYCVWVTRSHLGNYPINTSQYNEAMSMAQTLDAIAKAKGWKLLEEEKTIA